MMPLFSLWIGFSLPAALGVYWIAQSMFSAIQEFFMGKFYNKKLEEEEEVIAEMIQNLFGRENDYTSDLSIVWIQRVM